MVRGMFLMSSTSKKNNFKTCRNCPDNSENQFPKVLHHLFKNSNIPNLFRHPPGLIALHFSQPKKHVTSNRVATSSNKSKFQPPKRVPLFKTNRSTRVPNVKHLFHVVRKSSEHVASIQKNSVFKRAADSLQFLTLLQFFKKKQKTIIQVHVPQLLNDS